MRVVFTVDRCDHSIESVQIITALVGDNEHLCVGVCLKHFVMEFLRESKLTCVIVHNIEYECWICFTAILDKVISAGLKSLIVSLDICKEKLVFLSFYEIPSIRKDPA